VSRCLDIDECKLWKLDKARMPKERLRLIKQAGENSYLEGCRELNNPTILMDEAEIAEEDFILIEEAVDGIYNFSTVQIPGKCAYC